MTCPNCHKNVKDGTEICPHCDFIIDSGFLGGVSADGDEDTGGEPSAPPPPKKPAAKPAPRPAAKAKTAKNDDDEEQGGGVQNAARDATNRWAKYAEQHPDEVPKPKPVSKDLLGKDRAVAASDQLESLFSQFKGLVFEDKLTVVSAGVLVFTIFMPWRTTVEDGDSLGILSLAGVLCLAFAVGAIVSVLGRMGSYLPQLPRRAFPVITMTLGGLCGLTAIVTGISSIDRTLVQSPLGNMTVANSMPAWGVWLTAVVSGVVALGGFLTLPRVKAAGK